MSILSELVLVDTDVFSFLSKMGDSRADSYRRHVEGQNVAISFITVGELHFWALRKAWGERRRSELARQLAEVVIVPFDLGVCRAYAEIKHHAKNPGGSDRVIAPNDLWIAACARAYGIPLLSHNRRHFENLPGVVLISEAPGARQ